MAVQAKSILRNHPTNAAALELVVHLCLDFDLYDLPLWERVLQQVLGIEDYELLATTLVSVAGVEDLWYLSTLEDAWQATLGHFLEQVEDVNDDCEKAIRLMLKSPLTMQQRGPALMDACMSSNKEHLAIVSAFCHAEVCVCLCGCVWVCVGGSLSLSLSLSLCRDTQ